jgi:glycine/D-amino acid oxidase-like deaminating enzyme
MSLPIERPEVLVVGGGVIGTTIALELARRGREVVLLERETEAGGGASSGNSGYIVPSHATPLASPSAVRHGTAHHPGLPAGSARDHDAASRLLSADRRS